MADEIISVTPSPPHLVTSSSRHPVIGLFLISTLILFLELACIRWFPAHVLYLTFFTNTVLLASFLGMSVGCLAAGHSRSYLRWTPSLLAVGVGVAIVVELLSDSLSLILD